MNTVITHYKRALIFFSSPNHSGFTKQLLDKIITALPAHMQYDAIDVFKTGIKPCIDCKACLKGECPFNNDGMGEILQKIMQADLIIVATPVYFNSVPAKFKAIIDRMQQIFVKKVILGTPVFTEEKMGILLSVAGSKDQAATQCIKLIFELFFKSINATFLEHIAITNSDNISEVSIDNTQLFNIIESIN